MNGKAIDCALTPAIQQLKGGFVTGSRRPNNSSSVSGGRIDIKISIPQLSPNLAKFHNPHTCPVFTLVMLA